ncbi:pentapeptide repeat-containing protein [Streptomyces sp. NPDC059218]|uniref:pentapeptide repeat-containing protein n=1 Tax=unclassified Streptomyces TaxID=2593676 RepID=UPI00369F1BDC
MSADTRKNWKPTVLPTDPETARQLRERLASEESEGYDLDGMARDFRGADLSGGDFSNAWFTDAVLDENFFEIKVDDTTAVRGLTGTVFGPLTVRVIPPRRPHQ